MNNKNQNNNNQNDYQSNVQLGMLGTVIVAALLWKNEDKIRLWFYQNTLSLVLSGIGISTLAGIFFWHKFKKKEAEYFKKRSQLKELSPQARDLNYYKRKETNERNTHR